MHSPELTIRPNTYSLRARKLPVDRSYSPPEQPAKKKPRVHSPKKGNAAIPKKNQPFVVPAVEDPFFSALKSGKSINTLIEKWMKEYEESPDQAIVHFLQIIVFSCGCSGKLNANMIHNSNWKETIIPHISECFDEDSGDYPLTISSSQWRRFRSNFGDFLTLFVIKCKNNIIFDVTLMDSLIQMLTGLSDSSTRAFRHTATFAAMKISSAIVDVVVELRRLQEKNAIQIDTEKAKLSYTGSNERLENLLQSKADIDAKVDELTSMVQYIFKNVFVHRYRDIVPDVRTICITELGNWIHVYPVLFLDDSYLKYIGWMLFDRLSSEVRMKCVSALLPLYEDPLLIDRLELFTNKFRKRLAGMVMDMDTEVATKACQLLTHIYRAFPTLLTAEDCVPLYEMVYCNNRQLAVAAGEFVNSKLFLSHETESGSSNMMDNRQLIKDLVAFYVEGGVHAHPAYLVDTFVDINPMLKDWQTMVDILLSDEFDQSDGHLIAIMCCAVKQAATGEHPPNRIVISIRRGPGAGTEKKDMRMLHDERVRITEVFIPSLPKLLGKFLVDQDKVSNLIEIFLCLDLDIYSAGRYEQALIELMHLIERIVDQHSSDEITTKIARIFQLISNNMALEQFTAATRMRIIDGIAQNFHQKMLPFMNDQENLDEEDEASLLFIMRKLVSFSATTDIPAKWNLWEMAMVLLNRPLPIKSIDLTEKAVILCFQTLSWDTKRLNIPTQECQKEDVEIVRKRRDQYLKVTRNIINDAAAGVENTFLCLCDTLIMFNWKLASDLGLDHPARSLAVKLDQGSIQTIDNFVTDNVFIEQANNGFESLGESAKIELLSKRRNILAQYCKLFLFGVISIIQAAGVFCHFTQFFNDYGDIMRHLLQKCREMDKATTGLAIVKACIIKYTEIKMNSIDGVDQDSEQFQSLRELAKRFALSFGVDNIKNRVALATIHHEGIKYALRLDIRNMGPPLREQEKFENFPFLEILQEFSPKLHRQDKLAVLKYLDKNCPHDKQIDNEDYWQTFQLYRSSLAKAE